MNGAIAEAAAILREACGERLATDFPMAPLTTFRIGGRAALYLEPESDTDLLACTRAVNETGIGFALIGKGSNVLVSDAGFPGIVLRLGRGFRWAAREGARLSAGAAMPLPALAGIALGHRLAGLEFAVAIPATLGGSVKMNAGAHERSMSDVLERVEVFELRAGRVRSISSAEADLAYRRSGLSGDAVVVAASVLLSEAPSDHIRAKMEEARAWRRRTQPLAEPNCGSVFRNPPGDHAARLIEVTGAKGARVGGARVSDKHANFIVADAGARADDVVQLMYDVQAKVEAEHGVRLEPEVQLIGEFEHARR